MMTLMLLRSTDSDDRLFDRMLRRCVHQWCQKIEEALASIMLEECPDPELRSKYHPYTLRSRRMGNNQMRQAIAKNWMARGGGYVTLRNELTLKKLGLVAESSRLGTRASSEFVARQLHLAHTFVQNHFDLLDQSPNHLKIVNFTLDETRVCQQQVCI